MCKRLRVQPATQYEIHRTKDWPRRRHWQYVWAGLADPFHPRSLEDSQTHQAAQEAALEEEPYEDDEGEQPVA